MIENSIEANIDLIDVVGVKNMGFRHGDITTVVSYVLSAGEGTPFGKSRCSAGDKRIGLIVAEARKGRVFAGECVIKSDIEFAFIQLPDPAPRMPAARPRRARAEPEVSSRRPAR